LSSAVQPHLNTQTHTVYEPIHRGIHPGTQNSRSARKGANTVTQATAPVSVNHGPFEVNGRDEEGEKGGKEASRVYPSHRCYLGVRPDTVS
jgi:hypothetical protein